VKKVAGIPFNSFDDFTSGFTVEIHHMDIAIISSFQLCTKWQICIYTRAWIQGIASTNQPLILDWTEEGEREVP